MIYLISPKKRQYKANLHCHSVLSDGYKTPSELKEMYKSHGYSILAITDHERPANHTALSDDEFILLTGYECYIRPDPMGRYNPYNKEVHLNLFARDPENVKLICYNENCCKYVKRDGALDTLIKAGSERPREFTTEYMNEYIRTAKDEGYLVAYNHPYWSMQNEDEILALEGLFSLEICNYGSYLINYLEYNSPLYDKMLLNGKRIFCHAADDNHNHFPEGDKLCDSFGAFTMIIPDEFNYGSIISAMESGEMYASMGPTITSLSVDGDKARIECSEAYRIFAHFGNKQPASVFAEDGECITEATLSIPDGARYLRIEIVDKSGKRANTRAYSREEIGLNKN